MMNFPNMLNSGLKKINRWVTASADETLELGKKIAHNVLKGAPLCLIGDLGAGKTTLVKGIASHLTGIDSTEVTSPTFPYLNIYEGQDVLYHFDLYRIKDVEEFLSYGFDEYLEGLCCIEWAEKITSLLPKNKRLLTIQYLGIEKREIIYEI